ncbi:MAG: GAF domain-containing protein [Armatimonadetes bacterium]|nr:GAF domain-containing protein [Armatimonadota bacterium]
MSMTIDPAGAPLGSPSLSLKPLEKVQKTLTLATGLSLAVCSANGLHVSAYSHPEDRVHPRILARREQILDSILSQEVDGFQVMHGPGRLSFLVHPVMVEHTTVAYVIGGPVWESPPSAQDLARLSELLEVSPGHMKEAVLSHPAPIPLDMSRGRDMIVSLAELTAQMLQDQVLQNRNISTLTALYEVGSAISSTIELEEVLRKVLDYAIYLLEAENGSLMLLDEIHSELKMLVAQGLDEQIVTTTRVNLGEGISGWVAQEGRPRLLKKGVREEDSRSQRPEAEMESAMCVPLKVKDRCVGVLNLSGRRDGGNFCEEDLKILTILATHAASAIDNAQLYEQIKRQVSELQALHKIGNKLNSTLSLEEILPEVLENALHLLDAEAASIMLLDKKSGELRIRVAKGLSAEVVRRTRVKLGERVSGRVAATGKPQLIARNSAEDKDSALCLPLLAEDKVVGVLNIRTKRDGSDFTQEDLDLASRLSSVAAISIENAALHNKLQNLFISSIGALANSIDARDPYTAGHSKRVTDYSVMIAEAMGIGGQDLEDIRYAALLHDIGKIKIRDHILNKPGRLTDDEFAEMKKHPEYGVQIMAPVSAFERILPFILHHHERFDGRGYPAELEGEDIPLQARIMCVADCFDAMTCDRPYRKGMPMEKAVTELRSNSGSQFDPRAVEVFLQLAEEGKVDPIIGRYAAKPVTAPPPVSELPPPRGNGETAAERRALVSSEALREA